MTYLARLKSAGIELTLSSTGGIEILSTDLSDEQRQWIENHETELLAEIVPNSDDAKREAELLGILPKGSRQKIAYVKCLDCAFDCADGIRCKAGFQRTQRESKVRLCNYFATHLQNLTPEQEKAIRRWLGHLGETQDHEIAKVMAKCRGNSGALAYFLKRAEEDPAAQGASNGCR